MENQRSPVLSWPYYCQGKTMEELKQRLMYTSLELEKTRASVEEELRKKEDQLVRLKELLNKVTRERDEAQEKWQRLVLEKMVFQPASGISSGLDFSSSDCEESIVSSPLPESMIDLISADKPLPEKGKLLQAVMKAGPLLQTLLLAGPLPQWRHPPPPLESFQIPPVTIPSHSNCRKRVFSQTTDSPTQTNYQRIALH
ncbi:hypothetical protein Fmac_021975 [Flemingia macrophylla]|uniref:Uncharacterized protein n=1 Tax=Flemingia macrophylla TaxID=520843 RepID=A0ABD1LZ09_9FABA